LQRVLSILFGAGFTVAVAWAAGSLLLRRLRLELDPLEALLFSFLSGAACLSVAVFALCVVHQARPAVFLMGGIALLGGALRRRPGAGKRLGGVPFPWLALLLLTLTPFLFAYFMTALAPEVSPDGSGYHLGNVVRWLGAGGFVWDYRSMYSAFPQGLEMLFLVAFAFGAHSAAALVHLAFFVCLPLLILCYGRRFNVVPASVFANIVIFVSPVFGLTGSSAYNDAALVTCSFAVFYLLQLSDDINSDNLLILGVLLVGFCFALKYTGGIVAAFTVAALLLRRRQVPWVKLFLSAAACSVPWLLRNWIWLGNPFAPLFNQWFPNSFFTASSEQAYLADLAHVEGLRHWWQYPLDVTLYGASIPGLLGPVFLLAPFALLALRHRQGRRLLAAAAVFSLPIFFNVATRFLMPGMPFLALALGIAMQNSSGVLPLLAAAQALLCWPGSIPLYAADWSWRIREIPVRAALRLEPEADFLRRRLPDYNLKPAIDRAVPAAAKIFSFSTRPEAYLGRTILVGYESAEGGRIQDALQHRRPMDEQLKRRQVFFLLINDTDAISTDMKQHSINWGVTALAESHGTTLYRID
jgi:hypothetical protein